MTDKLYSPVIQHLFTVGFRDNGIIKRFEMSGNRDNYITDIYGYGPYGCDSFLWIDIGHHRLLTNCRSLYGSEESRSFDQTHTPMEWDLESDELIIDHGREFYGFGEVIELPKVFEGRRIKKKRSGLMIRDLEQFQQIIKDIAGDANWSVIGRSISSNEFVISISRINPAWKFDKKKVSRFYVYNQDTNQMYPSCFSHDSIRIEVIVRISRGLVAYGIGTDSNIYKIALDQKEEAYCESSVISIAISQFPGPYGLLRSDGIEVRSRVDNALFSIYPQDDLKRMFPPENADGPKSPFLLTPDDQWAVLPSDHRSNRFLLKKDGFVVLKDPLRILSLENREWVHSDRTGMLDIKYHLYNDGKQFLVSRFGNFLLLKRRVTVEVWEIPSGRRIGELVPGPRYADDDLNGFAFHPEERFFISSWGEIVVWDIKKNLESWTINGLPRLEEVRSLAFLWGGYLVAALTESNELSIFRFWWQSEILRSIHITEPVQELYAEPYGDRIFLLFENGSLDCYRYVPAEREDTTTIEGNTIHFRYRSKGSHDVQVGGTFNNWDPTAFNLNTHDGELWFGEIHLPDGRHEYKLVVDGWRWELDPNVPFLPGPFGHNNYCDLPERNG